MTARKHLKQLVRARMARTGESYASARRQVIREAPGPAADPAARWHFPGNVPATTALRVLLAHAGVRAPHTRAPYTEAMAFGIAGGIGAGVFTFSYGDTSSFFIAGRHQWRDDLAYLRDACARLGIAPVVRETAGARAAEGHLRAALADGPCVAWVDMAHLPHRALPAEWSGGGYHVVTVYRVDDASGTALIGDLADDPVSITLPDLARARGRIKKQKNRLLSISAGPEGATHDLAALVREGLRSCHDELAGVGRKVQVNFTLRAFREWGTRMHGSGHPQGWEQVFPRGQRLWTGLTWMYPFIEHYGTGGGLCRPLFADFLSEAAAATGIAALHELARRYAELGRGWTALADAALPDEVPAFREAKQLLDRKAELTLAGGASAPDEIRPIWTKLGELAARARADFPLSEAECHDLRARLQDRILALYEAEQAALDALSVAFASI